MQRWLWKHPTLSAVSLLHSTQNILSMYVGFLCGALFPLSPFIKISPFITVPCSCCTEEYFFSSEDTKRMSSKRFFGGLVWQLSKIYIYLFGCARSQLSCWIFSCHLKTLSCSMWDLVPWPGMEPGPPALGAQSLSHWTTREVPSVAYRK